MGRTSFPQHTSSIRTMDFSRDFGARRGKILSSHRVSTRWENHTMGAHKDLARKRGKARDSKIYARENTKNSTSFSGVWHFGFIETIGYSRGSPSHFQSEQCIVVTEQYSTKTMYSQKDQYSQRRFPKNLGAWMFGTLIINTNKCKKTSLDIFQRYFFGDNCQGCSIRCTIMF